MDRTDRLTLPPPEWTAPATTARVIASGGPPPLERRRGGRAEEATMRAKVKDARERGDTEAFRETAVKLARWLASRDRDLDEATHLAEEALASGIEDVELRRELAAWLESLGDPASAAEVLRAVVERGEGEGAALDPAEAAYLLVRVGVLRARAKMPADASAALEEAMRLDPSDALAGELRGALAAWAPESVPRALGAASYVEAARRRAKAGSADAEIEDLLRAFAIDPTSEDATRALADAQRNRGGSAAADETWRAYGNARASREVHAERRRDAMEAGDLMRALGAALDEGLDAELTGTGADTLNALMLRMGLSDVLAARLEARARAATGSDRAKHYLELARLYAGPLAEADRAVGAQVAALAADPTNEEALVALHAALGDAERKLDVIGGDERAEPLRRLAATLVSVRDEAERHRQLVETFTRATGFDPRWAAAAARAAARARDIDEAIQASRAALDRAPENRGAASIAWVDARIAADVETQARAIEGIGNASPAALKSVLFSVAAERYAAAGAHPAARAAAERACQADPSSARAIAMLADVVSGVLGGEPITGRDEGSARASASALERAVHVCGARGAWCAALASALEALGEHGYAVAWTQRHVALRPGDLVAIEALLARILRAKDPGRLGDALAWVLSQPQPIDSIAEPFARALRELAVLDSDRAAVIARRALEVYGPKHATVRDALLDVADRSNDDAFAAAVLERWLASGAEADDRAALVDALASRRAKLGDRDGEARLFARAVRDGLLGPDPNERLGALQRRAALLLSEGVSADGELALMEARAEALAAAGERRASGTAWRDFGAACWDLANDREGAVRAWMRAARVAMVKGFATFATDLAEFGGGTYALEVLAGLAEKERDVKTSGALAAEAARIAASIGDFARAFDLATLGLQRNPSYADGLEVAERAAAKTKREPELSALYDNVAGRALGRFGRRAAHYRGARFFEQRGDGALALKHAAQAFAAVPTEGATFLLLARTAENAGDRAHAVRAVEQVAESAKKPATRAAWLLRAATLAGHGDEGARRRVDVLLKAASLSPDLGTLALLADAARELVRLAPEERDVVEMRIARSADKLTAKLEGPDGARIALSFAHMALDLFEDASGALAALERALGMDADLDDYDRLLPHAAALVAAPEAAEVLARAVAGAEKQYANVGVPALKLFAAMAAARADEATRARAIVLAAERDADDDALVLAADQIVRESGDAKLEERLAKKVKPARRAEALRARARDRAAGGAHAEAAAALERAIELAPVEDRADLEKELRDAYEAAGRGTEIEQRAEREAQTVDLTPAIRAERWTEIADRREQRGDLAGALRALLEAAKIDPEPVERWSTIERVAEAAGDPESRVGALREIAARVADDGRIAVFKRLARAEEERGNDEAAEQAYGDALLIDADDEEADQAIEALVAARGRYDQLVDHLGRRAERLSSRGGHREALRALRLRRAAILEQRLGRVQDACNELALLLSEWPDNASALRYLADLCDREGDHARAAPLWRRAMALEIDAGAQDELELRAARSAHAAGDSRVARAHVRAALVRHPSNLEALELSVMLARAVGDHRELGEALDALATAEADPIRRSDMLLEAAQAAARHGDDALALARAQNAAQVAPERAAPQLLARGLEYRQRGPGDPAEARRTIEELGRIQERVVPDDAALRAFLLAEALDVVQGGGAGMRELTELQTSHAENALLAIGVAERLMKQGNFAASIPHFEIALRGSLFGLRRASSVALAAAEAAVRSVQLDVAAAFYDQAARDPDARWMSLSRAAHLAITQGWIDRSRATMLDLVPLVTAEDRARVVMQLVRMILTTSDPDLFARADGIVLELHAAAPVGGPLRAGLDAELATARATRPPPPPAAQRTPEPPLASTQTSEADELDWSEPATAGSSSALPRLQLVPSEPPPVVAPGPATAGAPREIVDLEAAVAAATSIAERGAVRLALARAQTSRGVHEAAERGYWEALADGSTEAGDELARIVDEAVDRSADLVRIRRHQLDLAPGNAVRLEQLHRAALRDEDRIYARAVEHVLRAFDPGAGPLPPPPLAAQNEEPGIMALLARPSNLAAGESLALVWEGAQSVFAKDATSYGITGVSRIVPGGTSALSRLYETTMRILDTPRIPVFVTRPSGALTTGVAVINPPSVLLTGEAREETPELRFVLGRGLAAALPNNVLVLGLAPREARLVTTALHGAFGPPEYGRALDQASGRLAESFWQLIPQRLQRRLQELLGAGPLPDHDEIMERALQSGRRVGFFLAGDFSTAARALLSERAMNPDALIGPGGLERACAQIPALADLARLAVSPEYADARWHPVAPASQRGSMSSSRFSIV